MPFRVQEQQILDFSPESAGFEGTTWWKPDGSDHFTVRDMLMGPDGMTIRTTDGRSIDGRVLETYIQSEVPISVPKQAPVQQIDLSGIDPDTPIQQEQKSFGSLKHSHPGVRFIEDTSHHGIPKDPINEPLVENTKPDIDPVELAMIERVLSKVKFNQISITLGNEEQDTIINGISTLVEVLNVKEENISKYITKRIKDNLGDIAQKATEKLMDSLDPNIVM